MTSSFMHRVIAALAFVVAASPGPAHAQRQSPAAPSFDAFYELGPDSLVRRGLPKGTVTDSVTLPSKIYPGVTHDYRVYVPAQYDGKSEVSL
ncbi:MAG TPA: esterase family protein, partial [Gammaproteobacteria bacterium]|nr:esterase family protein [Gammaproteobacteria bacterium]